MLVKPKEFYLDALMNGYAIGAFNVSTLEAIKAIVGAAKKTNSPVVIATSEKEMNYLEPALVYDIVSEMAKRADIQIALHLDHGHSLEAVKTAIEAGYTSVHFDGSLHDYEKNIQLTKEAVSYAKERGITVEGELGEILGSSEKHIDEIQVGQGILTNPVEAERFIKETEVDILAVSIGNVHGVYRTEPKLDLPRLAELKKIGLPMALHGGSGIPEEQVRRAIGLGIAKVNVNTELRMAFTNTLRQELAKDPDEIVPYEYLPEEIEAIEDVVEQKIRLFGSAR